jgi:hypothetical protein
VSRQLTSPIKPVGHQEYNHTGQDQGDEDQCRRRIHAHSLTGTPGSCVPLGLAQEPCFPRPRKFLILRPRFGMIALPKNTLFLGSLGSDARGIGLSGVAAWSESCEPSLWWPAKARSRTRHAAFFRSSDPPPGAVARRAKVGRGPGPGGTLSGSLAATTGRHRLVAQPIFEARGFFYMLD